MGHKVNPRGLRLGITNTWPSKWYADPKDYVDYFHEDLKIRNYIYKNYANYEISDIEIERTSSSQVNVIIHSSKISILLGKKGNEIESLRNNLGKLTARKVNIKVQEVNDIRARVLAESMAESIVKRKPFKKVMKFAISRAKKMGVSGIKVAVSGRLNGAEKARSESALFGKVSLHTLRYDIDYSCVEAHTVSGVIGVKVWICKENLTSRVKTEPAADDRRREGREGGYRKSSFRGKRDSEGFNRGAPRRAPRFETKSVEGSNEAQVENVSKTEEVEVTNVNA